MKTSQDWLNSELKGDVRRVFEPLYKRRLSETEVREIANNLVAGMKIIMRSKSE